jgi:predicted enzyme related to lactoylglutathione lyase
LARNQNKFYATVFNWQNEDDILSGGKELAACLEKATVDGKFYQGDNIS